MKILRTLALTVLFICFSLQREIYISQNPEYYSCYANKICDGTIDQPFGSIFEALNESKNSIDESLTIIIQNTEYIIYAEEIEKFSSIYGTSFSAISLDLNSKTNITISGLTMTTIVFREGYFSFELGDQNLILSKLILVFEDINIGNVPYLYDYFVKTKKGAFSSLLMLKSVVIEVKMSDGLNNLSGALFSLGSSYGVLSFETCSFSLRENKLFSYLLYAETDVQMAENLMEIVFFDCHFLGNNDYRTLKSFVKYAHIQFINSVFNNDIFWWKFEVDSSKVLINGTVFHMHFEGLKEEDNLLLFYNSNIQMSNVLVEGNYNRFSDYPRPNTCFAALMQDNNLSVNNISINKVAIQVNHLLMSMIKNAFYT